MQASAKGLNDQRDVGNLHNKKRPRALGTGKRNLFEVERSCKGKRVLTSGTLNEHQRRATTGARLLGGHPSEAMVIQKDAKRRGS